ncbi:hypothetical protein [Paenibacillus sp. 22594]|uniref:hypothetical protein n=1 Tax=Paenibacillus sp. 22594 TaxID=3453947 RepID=UPI003F862E15
MDATRTEHIDTTKTQRLKIALTGASEYIGYILLEQLTREYDVIALSRHGDQKEDNSHVEWRSCEPFSISSAEEHYKAQTMPSIWSTP